MGVCVLGDLFAGTRAKKRARVVRWKQQSALSAYSTATSTSGDRLKAAERGQAKTSQTRRYIRVVTGVYVGVRFTRSIVCFLSSVSYANWRSV